MKSFIEDLFDNTKKKNRIYILLMIYISFMLETYIGIIYSQEIFNTVTNNKDQAKIIQITSNVSLFLVPIVRLFTLLIILIIFYAFISFILDEYKLKEIMDKKKFIHVCEIFYPIKSIVMFIGCMVVFIYIKLKKYSLIDFSDKWIFITGILSTLFTLIYLYLIYKYICSKINKKKNNIKIFLTVFSPYIIYIILSRVGSLFLKSAI
ncbi:hypothetical protein SAMN05428976_10738 [Clostridium sp. USBA 49]|uniref:hypothetical protein n=1 Tax=Clostridium sp. USBA 49 TaxID=1881060 RepID=UPI00099A4432|nr:hypothetical protein [Clostridium sp. USBA 49]SKA85069.1 hypothetical protein SAMN05428976_10738 [Clostridium sp. USBA 49]